MRVGAVIVAGGRGSRAKGEIPKQYRSLGGVPALVWSLEAFAGASIGPVVVVSAPEHGEMRQAAMADWPEILVAHGGASRTASVRAGLDALRAEPPDAVLIHDAARPGLTPKLVRALVEALEGGAEAVAPALPVADALRRVGASGAILGETAREGLVRMQTPQGFAYKLIRNAYDRLAPDAVFDDDIAVALAAGADARVIAGDPMLMKITYDEDFAMFERLSGGQNGSVRTPCVGSGFDAHRFGPGDHVTLCGVRIAHEKGLIGHSDADAGWHALVDAILGALGAGDIGAHFPPSDPQWAGASSEVFLRRAVQLAQKADARIAHVDITLVCERPKIGPHREAMRLRTAEALGVAVERVSVKATTTEKMGFLGREEGLAAQAVATLERAI
jgi:2-C-methyl-D-erythritol 4-phosphate cytidylyltransferase/2-C-methyl-D-erythritol 2,4-cyclodiphosphate synthase